MKAKALTRASRAVAREMRERHSPRLTNRDGACVDRAAADTYGNRDVVSGDPVRHLKIDLIETRETRSDAREDHAGRQTADCDGGRQDSLIEHAAVGRWIVAGLELLAIRIAIRGSFAEAGDVEHQ